MGAALAKAFIPPDDLLGCAMNITGLEEGEEGTVVCLPPFSEPDWFWGFAQVMMLMCVYGYILFFASNMLSAGSELLLLVPSLAGIVGSVVLPILGAVPDGAIMLFSGLGPNAQEQLTVGIGALAGSTIMLLTVPWGLSIILGKVPIDADGDANYKLKKAQNLKGKTYGVTPDESISKNAGIMVVTACIYLVIQGPAFPFAQEPSDDDDVISEVAGVEHNYSLVGLVLACIGFVTYIVLMMTADDEQNDFLVNAAAIKAIEDSSASISLSGILAPIIAQSSAACASDGPDGFMQGQGREGLLDAAGKKKLENMLKPFFRKYDANGDGQIDAMELRELLRDLREEVTPEESRAWIVRLDPNGSGAISTDEFTDALLTYVAEKARFAAGEVLKNVPLSAVAEEEEHGEDEEMPEDLEDLSPEEQQRMIKQRAATMMFIGLSLILVFSDPMVDVMSNTGARLGVPPFYVSFILAPLASNASELIASLNYAAKKTRKTITVSLSALEGAACMNNTFCLAIFMALVYFKGLAWKFAAETIAILVVEVLIGIIAAQRTQTVSHAAFALCLFPASLVFVAALEAYGFD